MKQVTDLFTLEEDFELSFDSNIFYLLFTSELLHFTEEFESKFITIKEDRLIIHKGFTWEGCSPKFRVGSYVIGTPDGKVVNGKPKTYYASLVHDTLYTYLEEIPFTRKQVDTIFYYMLKHYKFKFSIIYYMVVRLLGGIYHRKREA